jgi:hypothetical protein
VENETGDFLLLTSKPRPVTCFENYLLRGCNYLSISTYVGMLLHLFNPGSDVPPTIVQRKSLVSDSMRDKSLSLLLIKTLRHEKPTHEKQFLATLKKSLFAIIVAK